VTDPTPSGMKTVFLITSMDFAEDPRKIWL